MAEGASDGVEQILLAPSGIYRVASPSRAATLSGSEFVVPGALPQTPGLRSSL